MTKTACCDAWQKESRRSVAAQDGFTLPETLVGAAVTIIVIGALVPVMWIAAGQFGGQSDRIGALDQDRVAFDDLTRLIREARAVHAIDPTPAESPDEMQAATLAVTTGDPTRDPVILDCGQPSAAPERYRCVKTDANGQAKQLIDGITDPEAFTVKTSRNFIEVALQLSPAGAERPVSLEGGVSLRVTGGTG